MSPPATPSSQTSFVRSRRPAVQELRYSRLIRARALACSRSVGQLSGKVPASSGVLRTKIRKIIATISTIPPTQRNTLVGPKRSISWRMYGVQSRSQQMMPMEAQPRAMPFFWGNQLAMRAGPAKN